MKRLILAVSVAALSAPAFAIEIGAPFEQTQLDRQLPNVPDHAPHVEIPADRLPYSQLAVDRALPNVPDANRPQIAIPAERLPYEQLVIDRTLPNIPDSSATQLARPSTSDRVSN